MTDSGSNYSTDQKEQDEHAWLHDQRDKLTKVPIHQIGDEICSKIHAEVSKKNEHIEVSDPDKNPFVSKSDICDCCIIS